MRIFKWTPDFRVHAESSIAPIWVSFPHLPVHFFSKESLFSIGSTLGKPMRRDAATANLTRPSVARVCMEMDLLKKFPHRIWLECGVNGFWQPVTYEKVPKYCTNCLKQGHDLEECKVDEFRKGNQGDKKGTEDAPKQIYKIKEDGPSTLEETFFNEERQALRQVIKEGKKVEESYEGSKMLMKANIDSQQDGVSV